MLVEGLTEDFEGEIEVSEEVLENPEEKHEFGVVGLAKCGGKNEFYLALHDCQWMDGVTACIGRLFPFEIGSESFEVLRIIEGIMMDPNFRKTQKVFISQCGQL